MSDMAEALTPEIVAEMNLRIRLFAAWEKIGPLARRTLVALAERLMLGVERYAADLDDGRDWRKEAHEEALDGALYLARDTLDRSETPLEHEVKCLRERNREMQAQLNELLSGAPAGRARY